ncbi:acyltransferase family protein [Sphingomonas abietis]|uniref:Acyltransferase n=1 Tax=Sphingomonas abietis TaxID=3012344 RepID=A0ABY7NJT5_9SPHN|nr:acyltransferase [Sphingomonas abietis]WBO20857.1 acyltransferase [Sphingomonas abietis]
MTKTGHDRGFFPLLDAIRWIAAVAVVLFHAPELFGFHLAKGYLAVDMFFVLSGVVVANAYEHRLLGVMDLRSFARVRLVRLYPLYLLGLAMGVVAALIAPGHRLDGMGLPLAVVAGALMIPRFWSVTVAGDPNLLLFPLNAPSWSLFFELLVNFGYALIVRQLTNRRIAIILALSGAAMILSSMLMHTLDLGWRPRQMPFGLVRTCFSFFAGVLIFRTSSWTGGFTARLPRWPTALGILLLVGAALSIAPGPRLDPFYDLLCAMLLFPLLVCCALPLTFSTRINTLFALGGTLSYALYVLHTPCHDLLDAFVPADVLGRSASLIGLAFLVLLLCFCQFVDMLYDRPVRRWLGGLQRHRPEVTVKDAVAAGDTASGPRA